MLDSCEFNGLANGAEMTCNGTASLPGGLAEGFHYLGVVVDDQTAILESDEADNARSADTGAVYISSGPCPAEFVLQNQTLTGTQMLQATTSATLGSNLVIDGESITVNAPSIGILPGTSIGGTFSIGTTPACP